MYQANLSHQMLKFYMWHVVELGLLEESHEMKFRITEKGSEFLMHYRKLAEAMAGSANVEGFSSDNEVNGRILGRRSRLGL
jgi:hypothetical protein